MNVQYAEVNMSFDITVTHAVPALWERVNGNRMRAGKRDKWRAMHAEAELTLGDARDIHEHNEHNKDGGTCCYS